MRVGIYIDGTWLLHHTARFQDPNRVGKYAVNWRDLPFAIIRRVFSNNIEEAELSELFYATSARSDDDPEGKRKKHKFIELLQEIGYDAHLYETSTVIGRDGGKYEVEKCVDMAVGVAAVSDAASDNIDVAVLVTGDRDFEPVVNRIKQHSKRVTVVTSRHGSWNPDPMSLDYKVVYIDDLRDEIRRRMVYCQCDEHWGPRGVFADTQVQPEFNPEAFWCDECRKRFGIQI